MGGNHDYPDTIGTYEFEFKILRRHPAHWGMPHGVHGRRRFSTTSINGCWPATLTNFTVAGGRRRASSGGLEKMRKPLERHGENIFGKSVIAFRRADVVGGRTRRASRCHVPSRLGAWHRSARPCSPGESAQRSSFRGPQKTSDGFCRTLLSSFSRSCERRGPGAASRRASVVGE